MPDTPLVIRAGPVARARLAENGWSPELFSAMVGASGGAKLLGLTHLDRYLFGDFLQRSDHPMELFGSSIGSWRHAALACRRPHQAITDLQERYFNQRWDPTDSRSAGEIVDALCEWVLEPICAKENADEVCQHPRFTTHIVTARGLGMNRHPRGARLGLGMASAALGNLLHRRLLATGFQRIVFSSGASTAFNFSDFNTRHVPLTVNNLKQALLASGSIPFLMSGQRDPVGAPAGQYWDGGVIDYHFDFNNQAGEGLVLYPHFSDKVIIGWFDKKLPWRQNSAPLLDRTVLLAPSGSYLASLPYGKIPDRQDFRRLSPAARVEYWQTAMDASEALAEMFDRVIQDPDPLRFVSGFT